jgi:hypothetical protein
VLCVCHRLVKNRADNVSCFWFVFRLQDWTRIGVIGMRQDVSRMSNSSHEFATAELQSKVRPIREFR